MSYSPEDSSFFLGTKEFYPLAFFNDRLLSIHFLPTQYLFVCYTI